MSKESGKVKKEKPKDDAKIETKSLQDRKVKKTGSNISTPRSFVQQKSSAKDIYGQIKKTAPKKTTAAKTSPSNKDITPKKDQTKSSSSSTLTTRSDARIKLNRAPDRNIKASIARSTSNVSKKSGEPLTTNVTVNSPVVKRKLFTDGSKDNESNSKINAIRIKNAKENSNTEETKERKRSKTRTLEENEVKLLTPEVVDNNAAMLNLTRTLTAKPKSFYIDLDENRTKEKNPSDEDVSYEDDFESYESDFESYQSDAASESKSETELSERHDTPSFEQDGAGKDVKDEEKMLDSGNFELRESQRSANKSKPTAMEHIQEDLEDRSEERRSFLTDEGFQEMSSGSATSSMKTVHVDILDRPLFIDFSASKRNKDKRRMNERIKQRAKDILSMVTLHEMSYVLFEMKPIPYDLYMATFGRSNYTQIAVQTYDDSVTEEIQTDELTYDNMWTQHPVEFSKNVIELNRTDKQRKTDTNDIDFTFLIADNRNEAKESSNCTEDGYADNPLRIYFEQKDGVGCDGVLPYEKYKMKLGNDDFCVNRLGKFLKKTERRLCQILSRNCGDLILTDLVKHPKCHFSVGYASLVPQTKLQEQNVFLKHGDVLNVVPSDTKNNLLMTVHKRSPDGFAAEKCLVCLWDLSVTREPLKILIAIDNIVTSRFRGGTDGTFVAALEDGSIHLWDLTETPTWFNGMSEHTEIINIQDVETDSKLTRTEKDREWNLRNSLIQNGKEPVLRRMLQACAYTTSAKNVMRNIEVDKIVGLEITVNEHSSTFDGGRRITGQVVALQRIGILSLWNMVQDKNASAAADIGKAYWSKIKLECYQTVHLTDHIEGPKSNSIFNLNAAKRRLTNRRRERSADRVLTRDSNFKTTRDSSINERNDEVASGWNSGVVCNDLKVTLLGISVIYLVAKNCGEILCCTRNAGALRVTSLCVATDTSSITCLEVSPHGLPFFLAGTDSGALHLYSLHESRVLITLDSHAQNPVIAEKCHSDYKGRFISTSAKQKSSFHETTGQVGVAMRCAVWSRVNPCCIYTLSTDGAVRAWDLSHSDIVPQYTIDGAASRCVAAGSALILLTPDGDVQVHKLPNEQRRKEYFNLFKTYAALL